MLKIMTWMIIQDWNLKDCNINSKTSFYRRAVKALNAALSTWLCCVQWRVLQFRWMEKSCVCLLFFFISYIVLCNLQIFFMTVVSDLCTVDIALISLYMLQWQWRYSTLLCSIQKWQMYSLPVTPLPNECSCPGRWQIPSAWCPCSN